MDGATSRYRSYARRGSIPLLSIGVTGFTNLLLPVLMQAHAGTAATGALTLSMAPLMVALSVQRLVLSQTYLRGIGRIDKLARYALSALAATLVASALSIWAFDLPHIYYLVLALAPIALFQDAFRHRVMGLHNSGRALVSDLVWLVVFVLMFGLAALLDTPAGPSAPLGCYAAGALAAGVVAIVLWPRRTTNPDADHPSIAGLMSEGVMITGLGVLSQPVLVAFAGLEALGVLRLAQLTTTLPGLFLGAAQSALLPTLDVSDRRAVRRAANRVARLISGVAAVTVAMLLLAPAEALAHAGIRVTAELVGCVLLLQAGTALSAWVTVVMWRARMISRSLSWISTRVAGSVLDVLVSSTLAVAWGAPGAATGTLTNNATVAGILLAQERLRTPATASR